MHRARPTLRRTVALAAIVAVASVLTAGCGDDDDSGASTTTTSSAVTTTTSGGSTSTTTLSPDDRAFAIWPFETSGERYDDPVDAATAFAVEMAGFDDPIVGEFQQGDSRSGEVPLRPLPDGPVTTVLVRQLGADDGWFVIGAITDDITVSEPAAQSAIDHPLTVRGEARAFEGTVQVAVIADGSTEPIGTGFVTATGGTERGPFEGSIAFDVPQGGWGTVLFFTTSAEDGRVREVTAVRVGFIGGD
jgi:hypothetical protein